MTMHSPQENQVLALGYLEAARTGDEAKMALIIEAAGEPALRHGLTHVGLALVRISAEREGYDNKAYLTRLLDRMRARVYSPHD